MPSRRQLVARREGPAARAIRHETMACGAAAPRCRDAADALGIDDLGHQFVGVQRPFHQQVRLAGVNQRHRPRRGGVAVRHVDHAQPADI